MVQKYLGLKHEYGKVDCIELIRQFYKDELNLDFSLPTYPKSRSWMKHFSTQSVDLWAETSFVKVSLTDAENYDIIAFKSDRSDLIIHYGLFLKPTRMLHIEEGEVSCIDTLSSYWIDRIHSFYRHVKLV